MKKQNLFVWIIGLLSCTTALAANQIKVNPGFENGKQGWTASGGTFTITSTAANVGEGRFAASWDSSSASQTLSSAQQAIDAGLKGLNGVASCKLRCASGTCTHKLQVYDGTNVIAESAIVSSTSQFPRTTVNFPIPSSGTVGARVISVASNEPQLFMDSCVVDLAEGVNLSQVSQAVVVGTLTYPSATNCAWSLVNPSGFTSFAADTDCGTAGVTGSATVPGTKIPAITFPSLPPGEYRVEVSAPLRFSAGTNQCSFSIYDGVSRSIGGIVTANGSEQNYISGLFSYTTAQSNKQFEIQANGNGTATCNIQADNSTQGWSIQWRVYRFPTAAEQAFGPSQVPASWSGYHDHTCAFPRTNAVYGDPTADASCALVEVSNTNFGTVTSYGSLLPGITLTPPKTGKANVCATVQVSYTGGGAGESLGVRMVESVSSTTVAAATQNPANATFSMNTRLCGHYTFSNLAQRTFKLETRTSGGAAGSITGNGSDVNAVNWAIEMIDESKTAPLLISQNDQSYELSNVSLSTAGSTATELNIALKDKDGNDCSVTSRCRIGFRSATAANGTYSTVTITSAKSILLGATDSIGWQSGERVYAYLINDTTPEVCATTVPLDEGGNLYSATALTGGAETSAGTLYCPSAHTLRPVRYLGAVSATWSNPNWNSATLISPSLAKTETRWAESFWLASASDCGSTPCTNFTTKSSGLVVTRSGTGTYAITFPSGMYSAAPVCMVTGARGANYFCTLNTGSPTGTSVPFTCTDSAIDALADSRFNIFCKGAR